MGSRPKPLARLSNSTLALRPDGLDTPDRPICILIFVQRPKTTFKPAPASSEQTPLKSPMLRLSTAVSVRSWRSWQRIAKRS